MSDPVAITPINYSVVIQVSNLSKLILKKDTQLYRIRAERDANAHHSNGTVYPVDHRFESMASYQLLSTHSDVITALGCTFSIMGLEFGFVKDGGVIEAESFMGPPKPADEVDHNEVWFTFSENGAVFITEPSHLPIIFRHPDPSRKQWLLSYNQDSHSYMIGTRASFDEPWDMVDVVEASITDAVLKLCEYSGLNYVSPPSYNEIVDAWGDGDREEIERTFQ